MKTLARILCAVDLEKASEAEVARRPVARNRHDIGAGQTLSVHREREQLGCGVLWRGSAPSRRRVTCRRTISSTAAAPAAVRDLSFERVAAWLSPI